ncbi:MAG: hypothetical protein QF610_01080, partial [Candidatus Thalassarchaeaceae archaeon]|nr:hypothetical protein [Candidatus Thalassarchaeaceae archaeon]
DIQSWIIEEKQEKESPGVHRDSAIASGTVLGRLMTDLNELDVDGPVIPDPEQLRLLLHAKNSRGGLPIYAIEPNLEDEKWVEWQIESADQQVTYSNLILTLTTGRRWKKIRKNAIKSVTSSKFVNADLGAASASCLTWWIEEQRGISDELKKLRDERFVSRLRGALANLRNKENSNSEETTLMVPIHQAWLPSIRKAISSCTNVEEITPEES